MCLALLAGCASPKGKFESKKEPGYQARLERVLVVYFNEETGTSLGRPFSDAFLTRLTELLGQKGVDSEFVRPDKQALDKEAPLRAASARFHPRHTLHFGIIRVETATSEYRSSLAPLTPMTYYRAVSFGFSLAEHPRDQVIWRGAVSFDEVPAPAVVADQFFEQLAAQQFLGARE